MFLLFKEVWDGLSEEGRVNLERHGLDELEPYVRLVEAKPERFHRAPPGWLERLRPDQFNTLSLTSRTWIQPPIGELPDGWKWPLVVEVYFEQDAVQRFLKAHPEARSESGPKASKPR